MNLNCSHGSKIRAIFTTKVSTFSNELTASVQAEAQKWKQSCCYSIHNDKWLHKSNKSLTFYEINIFLLLRCIHSSLVWKNIFVWFCRSIFDSAKYSRNMEIQTKYKSGTALRRDWDWQTAWCLTIGCYYYLGCQSDQESPHAFKNIGYNSHIACTLRIKTQC